MRVSGLPLAASVYLRQPFERLNPMAAAYDVAASHRHRRYHRKPASDNSSPSAAAQGG